MHRDNCCQYRSRRVFLSTHNQIPVRVQAGLTQPTQRACKGLNCWWYRSRRSCSFHTISKLKLLPVQVQAGLTQPSCKGFKSQQYRTSQVSSSLQNQQAKGSTLSSKCPGRPLPAYTTSMHSVNLQLALFQAGLTQPTQAACIGLTAASTGPGGSCSVHTTRKHKL